MAGQGGDSLPSVALLDSEGDLSPLFMQALSHVFQRFSRQAQDHRASDSVQGAQGPGSSSSSIDPQTSSTDDMAKLVLTEAELDAFTRIVNGGEVMSQSSKDEMKEYLDVDEEGQLTFVGFCEMYHLQSGSDADETWKDLKALGYNDQLQLVAHTVKEGADGKQEEGTSNAE